MDNNDPILAELRKISSWFEFQKKLTRWILLGLPILLAAMGLIVMFVEQRMTTTIETISSTATSTNEDWYDVGTHMRRGDFDKAIQLGEKLLHKTPQYPEAHRRLAEAYLGAGKVEEARKHYAEAFRLFPSDENEKALRAVEKRLNGRGVARSGE